jgi:hypothetical protein
LLARLRTRQTWKGLHAVEMGHVVEISDEIARPSVGLIGAVEELAHDVHAEAFSSAVGCREESAACAR